MSESSAPPPGWYFDGTETRWWDGTQWTASVAPAAQTQQWGQPQQLSQPQWGQPQWGDQQWGQQQWAPQRPNRTIAVIAHLSCLMGGFLVALVLYIVDKDKRDEFTRFHTAEALNFQLTMAIFGVLGFFAYIAVFFSTFASVDRTAPQPGAGVAVGLMIFWVVLMLVGLGNLVFGIIGAVKASNGEYWRYPVSIRFVDRGRRPPLESVAYGRRQ